MITSNIYFDYDIRLVMDETILKIEETHKYLGIVLASNNKWSAHIDTIIQSAAKQVSFLKKLKYRFSNNTLNRVYCTYIGPLLEYASEVWDGCRNFENQRKNLLTALSFISVITLDTLLYGCSTFDNERNALIINAVLLFIKETKRFD